MEENDKKVKRRREGRRNENQGGRREEQNEAFTSGYPISTITAWKNRLTVSNHKSPATREGSPQFVILNIKMCVLLFIQFSRPWNRQW